MSDCKLHQRMGGPSDTKETCKTCGTQWTRYRAGSFDWEYKDCWNCEAKKMIAKTPKAELDKLKKKFSKKKTPKPRPKG